jgi:predicted outer membrane repeat protein
MRKAILVLGLLVLGRPISAAILVVAPDGSGPYTDITDAVHHAVNGDIVELKNGVFTGWLNRDVALNNQAIIIRSQSGDPSLCVIDCEGFGRAFRMAAGSTLRGVTVTGGYKTVGGAVWAGINDVTIEHCVFAHNLVSGQGGAVYITGSSAIRKCVFTENQASLGGGVYATDGVVIEDCSFSKNTSSNAGGIWTLYGCLVRRCQFRANEGGWSGGAVGLGDDCVLEDCVLRGNTAMAGGAIDLLGSNTTVRRCTFVRNFGDDGGAIRDYGGFSHTTVNCTFVANSSAVGGSVLATQGTAIASFDNCLFADNLISPPFVPRPGDQIDFNCSDIFGNEAGDWTPEIADQLGVDGNISLDPLFCDAESEDLTLRQDSPCAPFTPPNPQCDLIGAWPVACYPTPVLDLSWGKLKTRFR